MKKLLKTWVMGLVACLVFFAVLYVIDVYELAQMILAGIAIVALIVVAPLVAGYAIRYFMGKE